MFRTISNALKISNVLCTLQSTSFRVVPGYLESCRCLAVGSTSRVLPKLDPRTPYLAFVKEKYPEVKRNNPDAKFEALGKMMGNMWRVLGENEKEVYRLQFLEAKEKYETEKKAVMDKMSTSEKIQLRLEKRDRKMRREKRKRRKLERDLSKPSRSGTNPFLLFVTSKTVTRGDAPLSQYIKGMAEMWKKMPAEDKEPFIKKARTNSQRYRQELVAWEKKMMAQGHTDLVRVRIAKRAAAKPRKRAATETRKIKVKAAEKKKTTKTRKPKRPADPTIGKE